MNMLNTKELQERRAKFDKNKKRVENLQLAAGFGGCLFFIGYAAFLALIAASIIGGIGHLFGFWVLPGLE